MDWCPTASNHYLNQCWPNISKVLWYSSKGNFTWKCLRYQSLDYGFSFMEAQLFCYLVLLSTHLMAKPGNKPAAPLLPYPCVAKITHLKLPPHLSGDNELIIEAEWCIYVSVNQTIICTDNGLGPGWRQAIIWNNAGILSIWPLGTNFNEILMEIQTFLCKKMNLKMSSAKWRPSCLGLNVVTEHWRLVRWIQDAMLVMWYEGQNNCCQIGPGHRQLASTVHNRHIMGGLINLISPIYL